MSGGPVPHPATPSRRPPETKHNTTKSIALVVLPFLCVYALVALVMTYHLTFVVFAAYAHGVKIDPSQVALITAMAGTGGTALGIVGGSMIQTEKAPPTTNVEKADEVTAGGPTSVNAGSAIGAQPPASTEQETKP